jgi:DNA-binding response OmpR family regulator
MRVLLVEDEPTAAHVLAKGLRKQADAVDLAVDVRLRSFRSERPTASCTS